MSHSRWQSLHVPTVSRPDLSAADEWQNFHSCAFCFLKTERSSQNMRRLPDIPVATGLPDQMPVWMRVGVKVRVKVRVRVRDRVSACACLKHTCVPPHTHPNMKQKPKTRVRPPHSAPRQDCRYKPYRYEQRRMVDVVSQGDCHTMAIITTHIHTCN